MGQEAKIKKEESQAHVQASVTEKQERRRGLKNLHLIRLPKSKSKQDKKDKEGSNQGQTKDQRWGSETYKSLLLL